MASIPHFYSDYHQFSADEFSEISPVMALDHRYARTGSFSSTNMSSGAISSPSGGAMLLGDHQDHNFSTFYDHKSTGSAVLDDIFQGESEIMSPIPATNSLPERFGISDMVVPTLMDYKMGSNGTGIAKIQNFGGEFQLSDVFEYGDDCCGFLPNFTPVISPAAEENWRLEYNRITSKESTNMVKVGRYTVEERKDRILRYLKKRNQRNFNKTIKYACRKTLADRRVRVRGRFARNNEIFEEETEVKKSDHHDNIPYQSHEKGKYCTSTDAVQIKDDDDDEQWLQEALASLKYVPYIAG